MRYHEKGSLAFHTGITQRESSSSMENIPYATVLLIALTSVVYRFNIRVKYQHALHSGLSPPRVKSAT